MLSTAAVAMVCDEAPWTCTMLGMEAQATDQGSGLGLGLGHGYGHGQRHGVRAAVAPACAMTMVDGAVGRVP